MSPGFRMAPLSPRPTNREDLEKVSFQKYQTEGTNSA
jgi:hypothetical protein